MTNGVKKRWWGCQPCFSFCLCQVIQGGLGRRAKIDRPGRSGQWGSGLKLGHLKWVKNKSGR